MDQEMRKAFKRLEILIRHPGARFTEDGEPDLTGYSTYDDLKKTKEQSPDRRDWFGNPRQGH